MGRRRDENEKLPYEARRWSDGIILRNKIGPTSSDNDISGALDTEIKKNKESLTQHGLFGKIVGEGYGLLEGLAKKEQSIGFIRKRLKELETEGQNSDFGSRQPD